MAYLINGKPVSKDVFMSGAQGFDFSEPWRGTVGSFASFVSPIDGETIANNKELREHNARHGVVQVGDEYINQRKKQEDG